MATMRVLPRVLLIADSWLFNSRLIDASRYSFTQTLSEVCEAVCFFHANSFEGNTYSEKLEQTLHDFRPNLIIALNSGCLRQLLLDYATKEHIAVITWFWDSPVLFGYEQSQLARKTIVFLSDISYRDHGGLDGIGDWMPFSSIPAEPYERKPSKEICFQGTLWGMTRILQDIALGLTCQTDGKFYYGAALYTQLTEGLDTASVWTSTTTGAQYTYGLLLNALSALKRAKTLSWFAHRDLHIYGSDEWFTGLWPVAPELISKVQYKEVLTHQDMRKLFGDHRCSLNIFHYQNKLGGPNLRILDSATHFTPILSDYNKCCHEIYPHGEAAFYFHGIEEAIEGLERILHEPGFGEKLANEAARILNAGHTHSHRIRTMFAQAELSYEKQSCLGQVQVVSNTLPLDLFLNNKDGSNRAVQVSKFAFLHKANFDLADRSMLIEESNTATVEAYNVQLSSKVKTLNRSLTELTKQLEEKKAIISNYESSIQNSQSEVNENREHKSNGLFDRLKQRLLVNGSKMPR